MAVDQAADFGSLLRRLRGASGLTQEELAERAGLSARGISDLERGAKTRPHRDTVERLSTALALPQAEHDAFSAVARTRIGSAHLLSSDDASPHTNLVIPPNPLLGRANEVK